MISPLRPPVRLFLHAWGALGKAPGWRYQMIEQWGASLAPMGEDGLPARLSNGLMMRCDLRDEVQRQIYFWGCYEPIESMVFSRLVQPGMVVIDAGANVGNYTLLASTRAGANGHVYAFEPVPATNARLRAAVEANHLGNVTVNCLALWNQTTTLELGLPGGHDGNAGSYSVSGGKATVSAEALSLDEYLAQANVARVDVIKIDIEGAELCALQGMRRTLMRDHPPILMEVNREAAQGAGSSPAQLGALLMGELQYKAWRLDQGTAVESIDSIDRANILFFAGDVPAAARELPAPKEAMRWARSKGALGADNPV
jgi:FkbM family methyltransferase